MQRSDDHFKVFSWQHVRTHCRFCHPRHRLSRELCGFGRVAPTTKGFATLPVGIAGQRRIAWGNLVAHWLACVLSQTGIASHTFKKPCYSIILLIWTILEKNNKRWFLHFGKSSQDWGGYVRTYVYWPPVGLLTDKFSSWYWMGDAFMKRWMGNEGIFQIRKSGWLLEFKWYVPPKPTKCLVA